MKHSVLLILLLTSYASIAAIYQWTDEQGITHFSDDESKPESATEIDVKLTPPSIASLTQSRTPEASAANPSITDIAEIAIGISIHSPVDQQTLRSNSGDITLSATLSTTLAYGLNMRLLIDGVTHSEQIDTQFNVSGVPIGTHTLQLKIIDHLGKVIASSELITVYLHRFKAN
ncbi:DUF4124 domain-containing protein [Moritella sp. Urea-trap-13]|uniref:DUF4124 domain-containing protein n=1 Tax=Moritella sp. Urea-trap-13 TaxID=2058327 RepID=UPI000C34A151|nr:DUF4124 domain-containing protein [Moritella sp. Urea-trap-13]PKH07608.1 DUF4124 domain-containing protein [Moritella sp. Urea-trap-13]